jgi:Ca-activated chloride channel family protein
MTTTVLILALGPLLAFLPFLQNLPEQKISVAPNQTGSTGSAPHAQRVSLFFNVVDKKGNPLKAVAKEELRLMEGREEREILAVADAQEEPLTLGLLVDWSGSRNQQSPRAEIAPAKNFVKEFTAGSVRAFLAWFVQDQFWHTDFTNDPGALSGKLDELAQKRMAGASPLFASIYAASAKVREGPRRRVLVIVTDGTDTASKVNLAEAIQAAHRAMVNIFVVQVTETYPERAQGGEVRSRNRTIRELIKKTGGMAFVVEEPQDAPKAFARIAELVKNQYRLDYVPTSLTPDDQPREISLSATLKGRRVLARQSYYLPSTN